MAGPGGGIPPVVVNHLVRGGDQGLRSRRCQALGCGGAARRGSDLAGGCRSDFARVAGTGGAVGNRAVEQAAGAVHHHQAGDRSGPGGLAGDRDVARIATEGGDVLTDPAQSCNLVEQAPVVRVGGCFVGGDVAEAFETEPVVEGDHDQTGAGQRGAVEVGLS